MPEPMSEVEELREALRGLSERHAQCSADAEMKLAVATKALRSIVAGNSEHARPGERARQIAERALGEMGR